MLDSYRPLVESVVALLRADASLTSELEDRIYTRPPQNEIFPFIYLSVESAPYSGNDFQGMEHTLQIQAFSRESSPNQVARMRDAVYTLLDRNESGITLSQGHLSSINFSGSSAIFLEPDGVAWQASIEFRVVITQAIGA